MIVCWLNGFGGWLRRRTLCGVRFCMGNTLRVRIFSLHQVGGGGGFTVLERFAQSEEVVQMEDSA
jgi:hypothetical protein